MGQGARPELLHGQRVEDPRQGRDRPRSRSATGAVDRGGSSRKLARSSAALRSPGRSRSLAIPPAPGEPLVRPARRRHLCRDRPGPFPSDADPTASARSPQPWRGAFRVGMGSLAKGLGHGAPRQVVLMQARSATSNGSHRCCLTTSTCWDGTSSPSRSPSGKGNCGRFASPTNWMTRRRSDPCAGFCSITDTVGEFP